MNANRYNFNEVLWPDTPFPLKHHAILVGKRGSEAQGTYIPPIDPDSIDDRDIMGVCVPPVDYYLGMKRWEGADAIKGCWDVVLYDARKFIDLLTRQNPNILCMLWLREEDYIYVSPEGRTILDNRNLFRSRTGAFNSFVGYANGQLKRMTHFGPYKGYMGAKRKALVDKYGYDTKNAAHLIRLLTMGLEYLNSQRMTVYRESDRDELLAIKRGAWPLQRVLDRADVLFAAAREAYHNSPMIEDIDMDAVNRLTINVTKGFFERTGIS